VDLASGCIDRPAIAAACVRAYAARVEEGVILVELPMADEGNEDQAA
jgi:hypothetical protein